ncbi:MAG: hypothetical protein FIO03_07655 [Nitrosopumilales archaeon]|jgi:DNA-binding response OmpR family regulator|nr:hypothetical protein [Nitrosopumilales archaeon]
MKRIVAKAGAANSIIMLTRVLLPDDESDVNAALREELERNEFKVDSYESPLLSLESSKPYFYKLAIPDITEKLGK